MSPHSVWNFLVDPCSAGKSENYSTSIKEVATSVIPGFDINNIPVWFVKNYLKDMKRGTTSLGRSMVRTTSYYPVSAICEEDLNKAKECNILKYNIFDQNNIRRDIFMKKEMTGQYSCGNFPGLKSSYQSEFMLKKNSENNMLWELHETSNGISTLRSINIEAGENPRNIKNQFRMCDTDGVSIQDDCFGVDETIETVDIVKADHEHAPQCADELDFGDWDGGYLSCDGKFVEPVFVGNQPFYANNEKKFEMNVLNIVKTIELEDKVWKFYSETEGQKKLLGKSVSQKIFGRWVGICDDWKSLNSDCGPHKYYNINSPAKEKKICSAVFDFQNFVPMKFNITTNSYQGRMGQVYEMFWSKEDLAWKILINGNLKYKTPDFSAACPNDIDYILMNTQNTKSKNERLWVPDSSPFPSGSPEPYYRNDIISYCHSTCSLISVGVSLNGTRQVLTYNNNEWTGGGYSLNSTHIDTFHLYQIDFGNIIASSEVRIRL